MRRPTSITTGLSQSTVPLASRDEVDRAIAAARAALVAYIWTRDLSHTLRLARALRSGGVYVDGGLPVTKSNLAFGGVGTSGFGREGGAWGLDDFVNPKMVSIAVAPAQHAQG